jgi:predicted nucleotide-binding protein
MYLNLVKMAKKTPGKVKNNKQEYKRSYVKQADVPSSSLDEALRVPMAILDHYAGKPTTPMSVAKALNVDPLGSQFKVLSGAAIAFGLIEGGAQAALISVTDLAKRILRPRLEGADIAARRESVLCPRIFKEFLTNYNGHPLPQKNIALNVLEEMGVPRNKVEEVLERIELSAHSVGFIEEIKNKRYVSLEVASQENLPQEIPSAQEHNKGKDMPVNSIKEETVRLHSTPSVYATAIANDERRRKVFITHGKNRELVDPIKKLLEFGELVPVVSVEKQSVSKPVPEKVMDDMRDCGAAIIHVDADRTIVDKTDQEHVLLNPNVLIEIGAAMAFYGRRFILLVKDGVKLPSNLQGLYEVRYAGEALDSNATIKLLEAIKDIKNYALPTDIQNGD